MKLVRNWKISAGLLLLALGCTALLLLGIPQRAITQTQQSCSLETLKGTYIFDYTGYTIVDGEHVPFSAAGFEYYNGDGTMRGVFSGVDGGVTRNLEYTGTYTVNPDCTSELTTNDPVFGDLHFDQFLGPGGNRFTFVQTDEGSVASGTELRVSRDILD
jgi:hypothetical protein